MEIEKEELKSFKQYLAKRAKPAVLAPNEKEISVVKSKVKKTIQMLNQSGYKVLGTSVNGDDKSTIWYYK